MMQKKPIISFFENQVELFPNRPAITCGDKSISYLNLNQQANSFAHYLMELGVTRNSLVAVVLPWSIDFIVAILAIIKAGGCYVPIENLYGTPSFQYIY